jgi:phage shock protein A
MEGMGKDFTEVLVAIGRIEEGIKTLRESIDRHERDVRALKDDVQDLKLDVQQLETQRSTVRENIAVAVSLVALIASTISIFNVIAI